MDNKRKIIIAVTGGISAYKSPDIISALRKNGFHVGVMQTPNSEKFITAETLKVMSDEYYINDWGKPVHIDVTKNLTEKDAFVVVPATANTVAKIAHGFGDNLVTDTVLALPKNVRKIICPALNTRMWENNMFQKNLMELIKDWWYIIEPVEGLLACGTTGKGKLPSTKYIVDKIVEIMGK